jgi:hypothetical protein
MSGLIIDPSHSAVLRSVWPVRQSGSALDAFHSTMREYTTSIGGNIVALFTGDDSGAFLRLRHLFLPSHFLWCSAFPMVARYAASLSVGPAAFITLDAW